MNFFRSCFLGTHFAKIKTILRAFETLSSAREIASMALSAEREGHTENVFHMLLILFKCFFYFEFFFTSKGLKKIVMYE